MPNSFYINSQQQLERVINLIDDAKIVAIDTEFTRETTYYPILSIVQIAVKNPQKKKESFIIDCLGNLDLKGIYQIISDSLITKILHSSAQDLQIFHHRSGQLPRGIFDTQVMANFCGFDFNAGYSSLVERLFEESLDKKQQRSDWQKRPLSQKQIEYALLDVLFLEEIYDKFYEKLSAKNRMDWYFEEMKNFIEKTLVKSDDNLSRNFTFKSRNPRHISQIKSLLVWREHWARKVNMPRQHFLRDEVISDIVMNQNFNLNFEKSVIDEIKKILDENVEVNDKNQHRERVPDRRFYMNDRQKDRYEKARKLISKISEEENFKEQFLITTSDLKKVVCEEKFFYEKVSGWRYQLFGKELEQVISNN